MTRPCQKIQERHFVGEAAKLLGKAWQLGNDRERPDFLVTEDAQQFGLEVCEIFAGKENKSGSVTKRSESVRQLLINAERKKYEAVANIPLTVHLVGDLCTDNMARIVPALVERNLVSEQVGYQVVIDLEPGLRVHVTKALRPDWLSVQDRVGPVDPNVMPRIRDMIDKKSLELPHYKNAAGLDNRLLIVANRIHNSGKLELVARTSLDKKGFKEIYFLSYPLEIFLFD